MVHPHLSHVIWLTSEFTVDVRHALAANRDYARSLRSGCGLAFLPV